jgi:dihydrofolate reductase
VSKVVAIEHVTLDGVMQAPARADEDTRGGFEYGGWAIPGNDPAMMNVLGARMGSSWSLLAGRTTYEDFAEVWPKRPPNPFTDALNKVQKYVASTTLTEPLPWENSTLLKGDGAEAVARLKKQTDKTLVIFGSGVLVHSLMQRKLVDELVLQIHPIVLGKGRRLFSDASAFTNFSLADSVTIPTGVIIATYNLNPLRSA